MQTDSSVQSHMNKVSRLQASVTTKHYCLSVPKLPIYMPELSLAMLYTKREVLSITHSTEHGLWKKKGCAAREYPSLIKPPFLFYKVSRCLCDLPSHLYIGHLGRSLPPRVKWLSCEANHSPFLMQRKE